METLVIGIDGGEWEVITPMIENGELPNISSLIRGGVKGNILSSTPPVSAPAWNSIVTGTNPGKHGIFDFVKYTEDYQRTPNNTSDRSATPFWTILNDYNVTTGLFKVPFTHPPDEVSGYIVSGFPTPQTTSEFTYPQEITQNVGPVNTLFENGTLLQERRLESFRENLDQVARHQTDGFIELLSDYSTDLGMIVYDTIDRAQHAYWKYFDENHPRHDPNSQLNGILKGHYKVIDEQIGNILKQVNDDTDVMVLSDHGFGPLTEYIFIDEWLERKGFLTWKNSTSTRAKDMLNSVLQSGWKLASSTNMQTNLKSIMPSRIIELGRDLEITRDICWEETVAFFSTASGQSIFINTNDRFVNGLIERPEYKDYISEVKDSLYSLEHPETGEPVIQSVLSGEKEFNGEQINTGPDLIIIPESGYALAGGQSEEIIKSSDQEGRDRSGDHKKDGIIIANGPSFETGTIKGASITDIAPTLLYLHRAPIPKSVDGEVLDQLFNPEVSSNLDKRTTDQYSCVQHNSHDMSDQDRSDVESRLEDIGYL